MVRIASPYRAFYKTQAGIFLLALISFFLLTDATQAAQFQSNQFEGNQIGHLKTVTTRYEDTMIDLAQQQRIGYAQLMAANPGIDPWLPGKNVKLTIPDWHILPDVPHVGLVLNTGELRLYYFPADGSEPKTFPIGIGREGLNTPKGTTTVTRKQADPIWRPTPRMRLENPELPAEVGKGDENPLGAYALYMGWPSYLIHGTNKPKAIGRRASSGCIRMYEDHIEWLYHNVPIGTKVTSVNQPIKMAWIDGAFYIEAEPNDLQVDEIEYQNRQVTIDIPDGVIARVREKAGAKVALIDWEKVRNTLVERSGIPIKVSTNEAGKTPAIEAVVSKYAETSSEKEDTKEELKTEKPKAKKSDAKKTDDWSSLNGG